MECKFTARSAIGVFDSGLGGLTVVKELKRHLPFEKIVYFGDTARVPYGTKSKEAIIRFSIENTQILLKHNVKIVVVACNSSASYALKKLRASFSVPCVGVIGPGARKAVNTTRSGRIGVIATSATTASGAYPRVICGLNPQVKVF
ncbi:MAG: glutamate racemase, partial [Candidatus Omnitrophica bacterium]|nr:glutamate racemase [Candidatus Omnitrophota bacterium]